jgi:uncharacterized repeat protein (TIGR04076 family)
MAHVVEIEVVGGTCQGGEHPLGQKWTFDGVTPGGMCLGAFHAIVPYLYTLRCGGVFPWAEPNERDTVDIKCADPKGITLRLTRRP